MRVPSPLLLLALTLCASAAHADTRLVYLGAGIARDSLHDIAPAPAALSLGNIDTTRWKVFVGLRPVSHFAVEAEYMNLGSRSGIVNVEAGADISYKAFAGYAVGFLPIGVPLLDVYGKAGLARWSSSGAVRSFFNPPTVSLSDNGTEFAWGAGTQVHVGNIGGRLEYESFNIRNTNGVSVVSLSLFLDIF